MIDVICQERCPTFGANEDYTNFELILLQQSLLWLCRDCFDSYKKVKNLIFTKILNSQLILETNIVNLLAIFPQVASTVHSFTTLFISTELDYVN